jgi:phosphohistidine swiveling domain-containing protein
LRLATDEETQKQTERFQEHNQYSWQISPLAETLGSVSPLSFELIIKLYQNAQTTFQNLGFRAREVNFIKRGANGAVYTASDLERQFFQLQSFFTPFTQHFRERDWRTKTVSFVDNFTPRNEQKNSLGRSEIIADLSKIFNYWQIANLYFALKEKNTTTQELNRPDEYELFSYRHVDYPQIKHNTWTELKISLKRLFLWQLSKLKKIVAKDPLWVFAQLEDFIADNFNELELLANYRLQLTQSAVCYPGRLPAGLNLANSKLIAVAGNQEIVGEAVVIVNPDLHSPQLPANKIIVAPFFASKWIGDLSSLKGVVLEQGGQLSHSAIVARELNIPYFINYDGATKLIQTGDHLKLKPKNNLLEQL